MMSRTWIAGAALAAGSVALLAFSPPPGAAKSAEAAPILYLFLSPDAEGAAAAARSAAQFMRKKRGEVRLRPVLLVDDFAALGRVGEEAPLYQATKELRSLGPLEIPLYDEEGLALSERWKIRSVPAFVLVRDGKAHVASGSRVDLETLMECAK